MIDFIRYNLRYFKKPNAHRPTMWNDPTGLTCSSDAEQPTFNEEPPALPFPMEESEQEDEEMPILDDEENL